MDPPVRTRILHHTAITRVYSILGIVMVLAVLPGLSSPAEDGKFSWAEINAAIEREYPRVRHFTTNELARRLQSDSTVAPILLDVRKPDEFNVSHLRDALLAQELSDALEVLGNVDKNRLIVVYCSVGYRSAALAEQLKKDGYTNVYNLKGSIFQWANEGRPVFADGIKVDRVHPYDKQWGKLLDRRFWPKTF